MKAAQNVVLLLVLGASLGLLIALVAQRQQQQSSIALVAQLAAENQALKQQNSMRADFKKLDMGFRTSVDLTATAHASFDMGTPPSVLIAVRQFERGLPGYELGNKGKTATICAAVPQTEWQYYEASRSLNRILWEWTLADPERRKEAIKGIAKIYTAKDHAKDWARNVILLEREAQGFKPKAKHKAASRRIGG